ncbi:protein FAM13B isoform X2 [Silurus meridionalis]|uniref:protein FAM13B isoform X2 n=1 Tax=Silurus meridionalis TaxID=175797 RepID=UPI001EEC3DF6|nr:protein FAM13B isoform X2 [Silurus meridionalis]
MRKSLSRTLSESLNTARVFGIPLEEVQQSGQPGQEVPLLVRTIVEYIEEHGGLGLEGLFLVNGNAEHVEWLRQRYDSGEEVNLAKEADLASAVSLLRLFLQELPEPIIPADLQTHILHLYQEDSGENELVGNMKYVLQQLPQVNYSLLRFLCRFLANVASLQVESWSIGALAAVFGPDIFHLDTDVEELREQESVSRILAELLENWEDFFDTEDDLSTSNDYSSINEQITELLEDEKIEACEELLQDGEDGPSSLSAKHSNVTPSSREKFESLQQPSACTATSWFVRVTEFFRRRCGNLKSLHITSISILPRTAGILRRSIQQFLDLQSSIDQDLSSYESQESSCQAGLGDHTSEKTVGAESRGREERADAGSTSGADPDQHAEDEEAFQGSPLSGLVPEQNLKMDLDNEALVDAENNINTTPRIQMYLECELMEETDVATSDSAADVCDLNANTESREQPNLNSHQVQAYSVLHDREQEASCPYNFPCIDFTCMHLQTEGHDPIPVFMSWQEESESGEAQLSPLAGRMLPLPLGEDAQPLLARHFLDFGHSQRFLQQDSDATSSNKALSCGRSRRASFSSKESTKGDSVCQQLTKKLQNIKKKIKQFEEQFEKDKNYTPSHADKAANPKVLKWMTDLTRIRKQLKGRQHLLPKASLRHQAVLHFHRRHSSALNTPYFTQSRPLTVSRQTPHFYAKHKAESELTPQTRPRSNTLPKSFGSTLEHSSSRGLAERDGEGRGCRPTHEETLQLIEQHLRTKREEDGWPEDIRKMTKEQLACEKTVLQKNLLYYEGLHGRPVTREERLIVKPLYDRYRLVKQMLTRASITPIIASPSSKRRNQTLQPIIEGETAHFCDEIKEEEEEEVEEDEQESGEMESEESAVIIALDPAAQPTNLQPVPDNILRPKMGESSGKLNLDLRLSSSNASSMPELLEQLWKARAEKKKLRRTIRDFEEEFYKQNGRNVQKEDRVPMLDEYKEYKRIKAKLRLLEVLISKQDSSKSI